MPCPSPLVSLLCQPVSSLFLLLLVRRIAWPLWSIYSRAYAFVVYVRVNEVSDFGMSSPNPSNRADFQATAETLLLFSLLNMGVRCFALPTMDGARIGPLAPSQPTTSTCLRFQRATLRPFLTYATRQVRLRLCHSQSPHPLPSLTCITPWHHSIARSLRHFAPPLPPSMAPSSVASDDSGNDVCPVYDCRTVDSPC